MAFWDFMEKEGHARKVWGMGKFQLKERNGTLPRISEGPLSGYSAQFRNKASLCQPNNQTGELNIFGIDQEPLTDFQAGLTTRIFTFRNNGNVPANYSPHMEIYFCNMESMLEIITICQ